MATYCYTTKTGKTVERQYPIGEMPRKIRVNGEVGHLDVGAMHPRQRAGGHGYPYYSDAFWAHPETQEQWRNHYAQRGIKNIEWNKDNQLKINSAAHRRALMKANGYVDFNSYI